MLCVGRVGLVIMLVAPLVTGSICFSGRMFGLVGCRLESGSACYMICRCLRSKEISVYDMCQLGWGEEGETWR